MFHHVVLANDDEESVADNETPLCVSARSNLGARLDENARTTRQVELVMPSARLAVVSGAVSSAHSFAISSSTPANSNNKEGRGNRRRNADVILQDVWRSPWEKSSGMLGALQYVVCHRQKVSLIQ